MWFVFSFSTGTQHGPGVAVQQGATQRQVVTSLFTELTIFRVFVPDGINSVRDYSSRWVGVCVYVRTHFFKFHNGISSECFELEDWDRYGAFLWSSAIEFSQAFKLDFPNLPSHNPLNRVMGVMGHNPQN